jgi:hypothetical protein
MLYSTYVFSVFWVGIMTKGYVMFVGVILLIVVYVYVYRKKFGIKFGSVGEGFASYYDAHPKVSKETEGFVSYTVDDPSAKAACAPKTLVRDPVQPETAQLGVGSIPPARR